MWAVLSAYRCGVDFECALSKGVLTMKYRILGIVAGLIAIIAAFMPGALRRFLLRKVKTVMYLVFG